MKISWKEMARRFKDMNTQKNTENVGVGVGPSNVIVESDDLEATPQALHFAKKG